MDYVVIFNQILILFFLIILGYFARKIKMFDDRVIKGMSDLVLNITLPAMIISSMNRQFSSEILGNVLTTLIIAVVFYAVSLLIAFIFVKIFGGKSSEKGIYKFALVFSNVGFMGYPVINAVFGPEALFYAAIYNLPFNFFLFTAGIFYVAEKGGIKFNRKMIINPGIISVVIGVLVFISPVKLPYAVSGTLDLLSSVTTPLSMIVIGGLLAKVHVREIFSNVRVYIYSLLRLLIIPFITWWALKFFNLSYLMAGIPIIMAAMPVAANSAILAEEYKGNSELASQIVFISTLLSLITIPVIVKLFVA